jgi:hypothetical protein
VRPKIISATVRRSAGRWPAPITQRVQKETNARTD